MPKVTIFSQSCKGVDDCGICAFVCPEHLFKACRQMNDAGYYPPEITDQEACRLPELYDLLSGLCHCG